MPHLMEILHLPDPAVHPTICRAPFRNIHELE